MFSVQLLPDDASLKTTPFPPLHAVSPCRSCSIDIAVRVENQSGQRVGFVVAASERVEHAFGQLPSGERFSLNTVPQPEGTKVSQGPPASALGRPIKIAISVKD